MNVIANVHQRDVSGNVHVELASCGMVGPNLGISIDVFHTWLRITKTGCMVALDLGTLLLFTGDIGL